MRTTTARASDNQRSGGRMPHAEAAPETGSRHLAGAGVLPEEPARHDAAALERETA